MYSIMCVLLSAVYLLSEALRVKRPYCPDPEDLPRGTWTLRPRRGVFAVGCAGETKARWLLMCETGGQWVGTIGTCQ
jgi:hypothetical protein